MLIHDAWRCRCAAYGNLTPSYRQEEGPLNNLAISTLLQLLQVLELEVLEGLRSTGPC